MLYLISAPPRTGKTLKSIEIIFKHLNEGRVVYTNIVGINIPGVITFNSGMDDPHDWRDLPNDSVVIYDEAHEHPAFADRNLIADKQKMAKVRDIGISLTLHGHFGFDIYMITQNPRLLAAEVLASVGIHYVMRRKFGVDMATIYEFGEAKTTFSKHTAKEALVTTMWRYPKHLYKFYISSEVHNVKKTFPIKYYAFALLPILLFLYGFNSAKQTSFFGLFGDKKEIPQATAAPPVAQKTISSITGNPFSTRDIEDKESVRIASVFLNGDTCHAYSGNGYYVDIPYEHCKLISDNPRMLQPASDEVRQARLQAANYVQNEYSNQSEHVQQSFNNASF